MFGRQLLRTFLGGKFGGKYFVGNLGWNGIIDILEPLLFKNVAYIGSWKHFVFFFICVFVSLSFCISFCKSWSWKIYGLCGLEHHTLEINGDVANPGRPNNRTKIELLSWMDAERWVLQWLFFRQQLAPNHWFRNLFSTTMNWQILASQVPQPTCFWTYQSQAGTLCNTGQWPQPKPPWGRPPERSWPSQTLFNRRHQIISTLCHLCCIFFLIKPTEMSKNPEMLFKSPSSWKPCFKSSRHVFAVFFFTLEGRLFSCFSEFTMRDSHQMVLTTTQWNHCFTTYGRALPPLQTAALWLTRLYREIARPQCCLDRRSDFYIISCEAGLSFNFSLWATYHFGGICTKGRPSYARTVVIREMM